MRDLLASVIAPMMRKTGFRFSKEYRWGTTAAKRLVYRHVNTVAANLRADEPSSEIMDLMENVPLALAITLLKAMLILQLLW
jgi:hypothetical protein